MRRRNKPAISRADSAKTELCEWNGKGDGIPNLVKLFELSICFWSWLCNRNETFYGCTDNLEKLFLHYVRLVDRENLKPKQKGMKRNKRRKTAWRFNTFFFQRRDFNFSPAYWVLDQFTFLLRTLLVVLIFLFFQLSHKVDFALIRKSGLA